MSAIIDVEDNFDIKQIADSGQCFRMFEVYRGNKESIDGIKTFNTVHNGNYIEISQGPNKQFIEVSCDEKTFNDIWYMYFNMDADYAKIKQRLTELNDAYIYTAYEFGSGIRILRQDAFEALISFIISQQKRIPSIMEAVGNISKLCGTNLKDEFTGRHYTTFPSPQQILDKRDKLHTLKLGYREEYIIDACTRVLAQGIEWFTGENAYDRALQIKGVGPKVGNCYTLFGCHQLDRFPIDTWINKILAREYPNGLNLGDCEDIAGIIQQYMFFYERNK